MFHPAAILVVWGGFAFMLQLVSAEAAIGIAAISLLVSLMFAPHRSRSLLYRSRWLLLSITVLFLFFTPGEYLPGVAGSAGVTHEGLERAFTHLGRLIALLTSLALLHERIGTQGLLAGLYGLLGWLWVRERTVVRLMLVLDEVERKGKTNWRSWLIPVVSEAEAGALHLHMPPMKMLDRCLIGLMLAAMITFGFLA